MNTNCLKFPYRNKVQIVDEFTDWELLTVDQLWLYWSECYVKPGQPIDEESFLIWVLNRLRQSKCMTEV